MPPTRPQRSAQEPPILCGLYQCGVRVAAHFLVDGVELAVTPFLTPGQTSATFTLSPVSAGAHTLGVQGEGTVSGCNTGTLAAWGGSVQITVNATAAAPIPAPGIVVTALALLLAAFALFRWRSA